MNAGKLRNRIRIEEPARGTDEGGGRPDMGWALVAEVWANIRPITGQERIAAMRSEVAVTHRIEIRYRAGLTEKMRVVYGDRVFNVRAVLDVDEARDEMQLLAEEKR